MRIGRHPSQRPKPLFLPSQPSFRPLPRPCGLRGRSCAFPELLGALGAPAAVAFLSTAVAAAPRGSLRRSDRPVRRQRRRLPRLRLRPRCRRPLATSPPSWSSRRRRWPMRCACGGSSRQRSQQHAGEGREKRSGQARMGGQAGSWWQSPQASYGGQ